jgi:hypothetical protein
MSSYRCLDCGLPDLHDGYGDGIGSCDCPRCEDCGAAPQECGCDEYDVDEDADPPWPEGVVTVVHLPGDAP